jgi:hypothetical protein
MHFRFRFAEEREQRERVRACRSIDGRARDRANQRRIRRAG